VSRNLRYSEDELRDQWAFIDSLVDSQAAALRSGAQDPEEEALELAAPAQDLLRELDTLRERVKQLEAEREHLLERVRIAEIVTSPVPAARQPVHRPAQPAPRRAESRIRDWWRRISR
jgi:flagellar motility protein MotE (MotC chaperone)